MRGPELNLYRGSRGSRLEGSGVEESRSLGFRGRQLEEEVVEFGRLPGLWEWSAAGSYGFDVRVFQGSGSLLFRNDTS